MFTRRVLPGFGLSFGITWLYLGLIVLLPLSALLLTGAASMDAKQLWGAISGERAIASYRLSFGAALAAAGVNVVLGALVAWVLARYPFPGRDLVDALIDFPFALPTAVAGLTLTALWTADGWFGRFFEPLGVKVAFAPIGVAVALLFVGFPFVVRTVQPVLEALDPSIEEAAAVLGAGGWQTFWRVTLPNIRWGLLYGIVLCGARAMGEFGAVSVVSGLIRGVTTTVPLHVEILYNEYNFTAAFAVASLLTLVAVAALGAKRLLEWGARRTGGQRQPADTTARVHRVAA